MICFITIIYFALLCAYRMFVGSSDSMCCGSNFRCANNKNSQRTKVHRKIWWIQKLFWASLWWQLIDACVRSIDLIDSRVVDSCVLTVNDILSGQRPPKYRVIFYGNVCLCVYFDELKQSTFEFVVTNEPDCLLIVCATGGWIVWCQ